MVKKVEVVHWVVGGCVVVVTAVWLDSVELLPVGISELDDLVVVGTSVLEVLVTGHTVVETGMVEVTVTVDEAGQLVTVGGHLVMV